MVAVRGLGYRKRPGVAVLRVVVCWLLGVVDIVGHVLFGYVVVVKLIEERGTRAGRRVGVVGVVPHLRRVEALIACGSGAIPPSSVRS